MNAQVHSEQVGQMERVVAAACRLAASGEVRAVHVVTERRPSYPELIRCRSRAEFHGLTMTVLGSGGVVLRSARPKPAFIGGQDTARVQAVIGAAEHRTDNDRRGLPTETEDRNTRRLGSAWIGELHAMNEGTR